MQNSGENARVFPFLWECRSFSLIFTVLEVASTMREPPAGCGGVGNHDIWIKSRYVTGHPIYIGSLGHLWYKCHTFTRFMIHARWAKSGKVKFKRKLTLNYHGLCWRMQLMLDPFFPVWGVVPRSAAKSEDWNGVRTRLKEIVFANLKRSYSIAPIHVKPGGCWTYVPGHLLIPAWPYIWPLQVQKTRNRSFKGYCNISQTQKISLYSKIY